jgi:hypothetical protein
VVIYWSRPSDEDAQKNYKIKDFLFFGIDWLVVPKAFGRLIALIREVCISIRGDSW